MKEMKDMMSRFGFHATPFTREIEVSHLLRLPHFDQALTALENVVQQRMSAALIAPAGTGKSALLRALCDRLPEARYRTSYVKVTSLSKRDMCREIAVAAGARAAGCFPSLVRNLQEHFLNSLDTDALRPVLLLDEAHDLRPEVLAMIRVLTNFEMDSRLVVSVVLAGQSRLRTLLRHDTLDDVARRLAHYATLRTLSRDEHLRYIEHRCTVAGAISVPFGNDALEAVFEIARGNLRATDRLALKTLEYAHGTGDDVAAATHVVEARKVLWP